MTGGIQAVKLATEFYETSTCMSEVGRPVVLITRNHCSMPIKKILASRPFLIHKNKLLKQM